MKILLIGGPKFLGRHLTAAALAAGHAVTHFNRGNYPAADFPDIETIRGDRYRDLDKLSDRKWDAVIDTCGYLPQNVKATAGALANSADRYVFISSISVYSDLSKIDFDESTPLAGLTQEQQKRVDDIDLSGEITAFKLEDMYGALKAGCEQAVESAMPGRTIVIRPGLIVGPYDTVDRFTYWVTRVARGGEVLAPGEPGRFVQLIDARDMSEWVIEMLERGETGIYNATGKPFELTMENMLVSMRETSGSDASFTWADENFLAAENIQPWSEMPFYLPESNEGSRGFLSANIDKATKTGLKFRPLKETIGNTLDWWKTNSLRESLKAGITAEREAELLGKITTNAE
jgi:2'-hydroxyisoflavone reductase